MTLPTRRFLPPAAAIAIVIGVGLGCATESKDPGPSATTKAATPENAKAFLDEANATLLKLGIEGGRASWVYETYITPDTEALNAKATEAVLNAAKQFAKEAARFDSVTVPPDQRRQLDLLKLQLELAPPGDPKEAEEVTALTTKLQGIYGRGKWCKDPGKPQSGREAPPTEEKTCLDIEKITEILATSRDEKKIRETWEGWHTISVPMRADYARFVELANKGAKELGFADTGAMWRAKYDMPADAFTKEVDRLWEQVKPLYLSLHAYVRMKLHEKYGDVVPAEGPIPAHITGNIWAQDWGNVMDLAAPGTASPGFSLTDILKRRKMSAVDMVKAGERFYSSLGLAPMPPTFWERSLFTKPPARDVVCHASAWSIDYVDDLRIKMCIDPTEEDFTTIHHELGHNYYQRAYNQLPIIFRDSANQAFHEAIGDTIAL